MDWSGGRTRSQDLGFKEALFLLRGGRRLAADVEVVLDFGGFRCMSWRGQSWNVVESTYSSTRLDFWPHS